MRRRLLLLAGLLAALAMLPFRGQDAAHLLPVQTLLVDWDGESCRLAADNGLAGSGPDLAAALGELEASAPGTVFLKTAEQVVLTRRALPLLDQVVQSPALRPAAGLCLTPSGALDLELAGQYLARHPDNRTLARVRAVLAAGQSPGLPLLRPVEGGFLLEEP